MLINAGQPHILILGAHSQRGRHNFNFDKYTVHLRYQMNTEGVTIELYPPLKKKQTDYVKFVSPYDVPCLKPANRPSVLMGHKKNVGKTVGARDAQKSKKESINPVEQPQTNKRAEKRKSTALKKCAIQRIFNFSETPNITTNNFPYEGCCPANTDSQKMVMKGRQYLKDEFHTAGLPMKSISAGSNLRDTLSGPQVRPKPPYPPLHKKFSMTVVQTLHKIKREQLKRVNWPTS